MYLVNKPVLVFWKCGNYATVYGVVAVQVGTWFFVVLRILLSIDGVSTEWCIEYWSIRLIGHWAKKHDICRCVGYFWISTLNGGTFPSCIVILLIITLPYGSLSRPGTALFWEKRLPF